MILACSRPHADVAYKSPFSRFSTRLPLTEAPAMSHKFKKGYYVRGQFVAEGSELDLELKRELKGTDDQSRTDLKRESTELQKLGEDLLTLRADLMSRLPLSEKLFDAVTEAKRITNFEGKRRQMQFIGKLMRLLDPVQLEAVRKALDEQQNGSASEKLALHLSETWRDRLIAEDDAFAQWIIKCPGTDSQQLRALIRQARKDYKPEKPGAAPRHGRAYRDIFQLVREQLSPENATMDDPADDVPYTP
jgi:ribosome-associated protein